MTDPLFNSVKKNNSLILCQFVVFITLVRPVSIIITLIISLYTFVCPVPKLLAYGDNTNIANNPIDRAILITQPKLFLVLQSIPSPQALIPSSNLSLAKSINASQSSSANSAESVMGTFLNPKILLGSAINQMRNGTSSEGNKFENGNNASSFFGNYKVLLLTRQIIPPKNYILLFEAQASEDSNGQIAAKLPCDVNYTSPLKLFVVETNFGFKIQTRLIDLHVISELSKPGSTCVYEAVVPKTTSISMQSTISDSAKYNIKSMSSGLNPQQTINSVGLLNPTNYQQVLPPTSSIALGFNEAHSTTSPRK